MLKTIPCHLLKNSEYNQLLLEASSPYADADYLCAIGENCKLIFDDEMELGLVAFIGKKIGFSYAYQPPFVQQFQFLGRNASSLEKCKEFLDKFSSQFHLTEISIDNTSLQLDSTWETQERRNAILSLSEPYEAIFKRYSNNHKRALTKVSSDIEITECQKEEEFFYGIDMFVREARNKFKLQKGYSQILKRLVSTQVLRQKIKIYQAKKQEDLLAILIVFENKGVMVNLLSYATPIGRATNSLFALIDFAIKQKSNSCTAFDFEGSDNEGIFRFYKGFGAQNIPYLHVRNNSLPPIIRWLK